MIREPRTLRRHRAILIDLEQWRLTTKSTHEPFWALTRLTFRQWVNLKEHSAKGKSGTVFAKAFGKEFESLPEGLHLVFRPKTTRSESGKTTAKRKKHQMLNTLFCQKIRRHFVFFIFSFIFWIGTFAHGADRSAVFKQLGGPINLQEEFPNLFIPGSDRSLPADKIPDEVIQKTKLLLTRVIQHIAPHLLTAETDGHTISLLKEAEKRLHHVDPQGHLILAPGIVRTLLGFIYDELHKEWRNNPHMNPTAVLNRLLSESSFDAKLILGVGSDFDLYVTSTRLGTAIETVESVFKHLLQNESLSNTEDQFLMRLSNTVGEVHGADIQLADAIAQGGSTLDMLSFDLTTGEFINPSRDQLVIETFLRGYYDYLDHDTLKDPVDAKTNQRLLKQAIRGLRPLLEIPFLRLKTSTIILEDLSVPLDKKEIRGAESIKKQLMKLTINARLSAGNNRFYRNPEDPMIQRFFEITDALNVPFKIFVPLRPRWKTPKKGLPKEFLISAAEFKKRYADKYQRIYHGTDDIGAVTSILRNGFYLSSSEQGLAAYGRGLYTSGRVSTAGVYANRSKNQAGSILGLQLAENQWPLRIVDLEELLEANFAKTNGLTENWKELMDVLVNEYHVDIIINDYPLIQNLDVLRVDDDSVELSKILLNYWLRGDVDRSAVRNLIIGLSTHNQKSLRLLLDRLIAEYQEKPVKKSVLSALKPSNLLARLKQTFSLSPKAHMNDFERRTETLFAIFEGLLETQSLAFLESMPQWQELVNILEFTQPEYKPIAAVLRSHQDHDDATIMELSRQNTPLMDSVRTNRIKFGSLRQESLAFFAQPANFSFLNQIEKEKIKPLLSFEQIIPLHEHYSVEERINLAQASGTWPQSWKLDSSVELRALSEPYVRSLTENLERLGKVMTTNQFKELLLQVVMQSKKLSHLQDTKNYISRLKWTVEEVGHFYKDKEVDLILLLKTIAVFQPSLKLTSQDILQGREALMSIQTLHATNPKKKSKKDPRTQLKWSEMNDDDLAFFERLLQLMNKQQWQELTTTIWEHSGGNTKLALEEGSFELIYQDQDFVTSTKNSTRRKPAKLDLLQILCLIDHPTTNSTLQKLLFTSDPLDGRLMSLLKTNNYEQRVMIYHNLYNAYRRGLLDKNPLGFMSDDHNFQIRMNSRDLAKSFEAGDYDSLDSPPLGSSSAVRSCSQSLQRRHF